MRLGEDRNPLPVAELCGSVRSDARKQSNTPGRIRTCDLRIRSPRVDSVNNSGDVTYKPGTADPATYHDSSSKIDPDLGRVVDAWPALPDALKAAILALIEASSADRGKR